jgi:hypothetical protein
MTPQDIERWVDKEYARQFCGDNNQSEVSPNLGRFQKELEKINPGHDAAIYKAIIKYAGMLKTAQNTCPTTSTVSQDQSLIIAVPENTCATAKLDNVYQAARTQPATQPIQTHHGMQSSTVDPVDTSRTITNTWSPPSSSHVINSREGDTGTKVKLPDDRDSFRNDLLARKLNQLEISNSTSHTVS